MPQLLQLYILLLTILLSETTSNKTFPGSAFHLPLSGNILVTTLLTVDARTYIVLELNYIKGPEESSVYLFLLCKEQLNQTFFLLYLIYCRNVP